MNKFKCARCFDGGWTLYPRSMMGKDRQFKTVLMPDVCNCKAGENYSHIHVLVAFDPAGPQAEQ